jgi:hypothetical protein
MRSQPPQKWRVIGGIAVVFWVTACASSNVLNIQYKLPALASGPIQRTVAIAFEDARKNSALLTPAAQEELEGLLNVYALTVSKPGQVAELKGAYALEPFFMEILRYRLEDAGLKVVPTSATADARFTFVLQEFQLDFRDRYWNASAAYEARMSKNGSLLSSQVIRGSAGRAMLLKRSDAEKVLGELVSDAINQMDLGALFKQAGL